MIRKSKTSQVLAMRLQRTVDARGKPFVIHLAYCSKWPRGLDVGLLDSGFPGQRYCIDTLRQTGNMEEAIQAHQKGGGKGRRRWDDSLGQLQR